MTTKQQETKPKWTGGEWIASSQEVLAICPTETLIVAELQAGNRWERAANAHLLAASTGMYEAAKRFVEYYRSRRARLGNGQALKSWDEFEAALAKAEERE